MKPKKIKIIGKERSLDEVVEGVVILNEVIEENKYNYRKAWRTWLPEFTGQKGRMVYVPVVAMRKCYSETKDEHGNSPYFIFVLNQARDERPKSEEGDEKESHCKLCKNLIEEGMVMGEIDDYDITANGFPYHLYASLLINKHKRAQTDPIRPEEVGTWIKTSILLGQHLFFNSDHAGASIKEHQHVQMVDPIEMQMDNKIITYPLLDDTFVKKEALKNSPDVFRIRNYPVDALMFTGTDAPYKVAYATKLLGDEDAAFNIIVNKNETYVIGRNKARETSICMGRRVGGYEITGVALLGDIEEKSGQKNITVKGAKIFSNMSYDVVRKNIVGATRPLESIARHF